MSDGFTVNSHMTERVVNASPGSQWRSADANGIQDKIIDLSTDLDEVRGSTCRNRMGTVNQTDSPAPDMDGGRSIWFYKESTATTSEVVLDNSMDWRDRLVDARIAFCDRSTGADYEEASPGEASDAFLTRPWDEHRMFYSQQGQNGSASQPGIAPVFAGGADQCRIYARSTDGALCMKRNAATDGPYLVVGHVGASPQLNRY